MISHANRGATLERMVEISNAQYRRKGLAVVHKIPTAWIPIRVDGKIVSAKVAQKATVDFVGCVAESGRLVAFDAKENRNLTSFPLDKRWEHEVQFIYDVIQAGGLGFLLIEQLEEEATTIVGKPRQVRTIYLLPGGWLVKAWRDAYQLGGRKSIPHQFLRTCPVVPSSTATPVDYLAALKAAGYQL